MNTFPFEPVADRTDIPFDALLGIRMASQLAAEEMRAGGPPKPLSNDALIEIEGRICNGPIAVYDGQTWSFLPESVRLPEKPWHVGQICHAAPYAAVLLMEVSRLRAELESLQEKFDDYKSYAEDRRFD